jgi:putative flippase GtrA
MRFVVVGSSAAALQFFFAWGLLWYGLRPALAAALAFSLAFLLAYNVHRRWTFATDARHLTVLPRYILVQIASASAAAIAAEVALSWLHWPNTAIALVATLVSGSLAYVLTSRWAFAV